MARNLTGNTGDYLTRADSSAIRFAFPVSIGFWWQGTSHGNFTYILSKLLVAGDHPSYGFSFNAGGELRFLIGWGTNPSEVTVTSGVAGSLSVYDGNWHYVTGVYDGATIKCYVDGVLLDSQVETRAIAYSTDALFVGSFDGSILGATGNIAELSVWSVALTTSDMSSLTSGFSALLVRPDKLSAYWRLLGVFTPETERVQGLDLTTTGTLVAAAHTRMYYHTSSGSRRLTTAAVVGSSKGQQFMSFF